MDAGLIGPECVVAAGVSNVILSVFPEEDEGQNGVRVYQENGKEIDLNAELLSPDCTIGGMDGITLDQCKQVVEGRNVGGPRVTDDDPFDLVPILRS